MQPIEAESACQAHCQPTRQSVFWNSKLAGDINQCCWSLSRPYPLPATCHSASSFPRCLAPRRTCRRQQLQPVADGGYGLASAAGPATTGQQQGSAGHTLPGSSLCRQKVRPVAHCRRQASLNLSPTDAASAVAAAAPSMPGVAARSRVRGAAWLPASLDKALPVRVLLAQQRAACSLDKVLDQVDHLGVEAQVLWGAAAAAGAGGVAWFLELLEI